MNVLLLALPWLVRHRKAVVAAALASLAVVATAFAVLVSGGAVAASVLSQSGNDANAVPCQQNAVDGEQTAAGLTAAQTSNAALLLATADQVIRPWAIAQGLPADETVARAQVVALITGYQESTLLNLPSLRIPESLSYPHDTYPDGSVPAGDHLSIGLMQQQPWWWGGDVAVGMDPRHQARQFFGGADSTPSIPGLVDVPQWWTLPPTQAAQQVQRSAYPEAYARHVPLAMQILDQAGTIGLPDLCAPPSFSGQWVVPLAEGTYTISSGFGQRCWSSGQCEIHTGIDMAAPERMPIMAAADGVVTASGASGTGYGIMVKIDHGQGVSTLYAHMSATAGLGPGQPVAAGQVIGYVGTTGRSTGNHLHYEVRENDRPVDPTPYLESAAAVADTLALAA